MLIEFRLPQFGMGMSDGTINKWFKAEGDLLVEGETLLEMKQLRPRSRCPLRLAVA